MTTVSAPTADVTAVPVDLARPDAQSSGHDTAMARNTVIAGIGGFATWCAPPRRNLGHRRPRPRADPRLAGGF
jgi:hypothetical protein